MTLLIFLFLLCSVFFPPLLGVNSILEIMSSRMIVPIIAIIYTHVLFSVLLHGHTHTHTHFFSSLDEKDRHKFLCPLRIYLIWWSPRVPNSCACSKYWIYFPSALLPSNAPHPLLFTLPYKPSVLPVCVFTYAYSCHSRCRILHMQYTWNIYDLLTFLDTFGQIIKMKIPELVLSLNPMG